MATTSDLNILLVRPDHVGDVILTLPAVTYLRRALANARLTYVSNSTVRELVARCPAVDHCVGLPFPDPSVAEVPPSLLHAARAAPVLSRQDAALLLRPNDPVGARIVTQLGIRIRIGFPQSGTRPFLTSAVDEPNGHHASLGYRLVDRLLHDLGRPQDIPPPTDARESVVRDIGGSELLTEESRDIAEAEELLSEVEHVAGRVPLVLHPGSGWILKNWGAERWAQVARSVFDRYGQTPLITGTDPEKSLCDDVVKASGGRALSVAGRLTLPGFASLLRRSRVLVAVDSGPLHLAAVVGCPVVGLYGPVTERAAGPLCDDVRHRALGVALPCRPCGQMVDPPCGAVQNPACITGITVPDVLAALDDLLGVCD